MTDQLESVERWMRETVEAVEHKTASLFGPRDVPIYGLVRYHLGWADADFQPRQYDPGKRIRPRICLMSCAASGGDVSRAVPVAAAIEFLHNFTLVHDDIQDHGEMRRHRRTVWTIWGEAQAINAGDALFALSQLALNRAIDVGIAAHTIVDLSREFNDVTLRIVEGQVLDLSYEQRWDLTTDDYLRMIGGKTAAIIAFAAWSGAVMAGADLARQRQFHAFGRALGLGFQVRDDMLGIWGAGDVTGKPTAADVWRRKKSLPIIALFNAASEADREQLRAIYSAPTIDQAEVDRVLELLAHYQIEAAMDDVVHGYHDEARRQLDDATSTTADRAELMALLDRLSTRDF